jgi:hypothetical protein
MTAPGRLKSRTSLERPLHGEEDEHCSGIEAPAPRVVWSRIERLNECTHKKALRERQRKSDINNLLSTD